MPVVNVISKTRQAAYEVDVMKKALTKYAATFLATLLGCTAAIASDAASDAASIEVLGGWREADGTHMAALRITLADGWHTYWRSPGDAGVPPAFHWGGTRNVDTVKFHWPVPDVHVQNGMRTLGYTDQVVIPITVSPKNDGSMRIKGKAEIGVCKDICIPTTLRFDRRLPEVGALDGQIAAALVEQPLSAREAGAKRPVCTITPADDGVVLKASVTLPKQGPGEISVLEVANPNVWVSEAETIRTGGTISATATLLEANGKPFSIDRSGVIMTVLAGGQAVEIKGCTGG
jgi:DsbC/DsbD-like thiol-disulfide interchange protein